MTRLWSRCWIVVPCAAMLFGANAAGQEAANLFPRSVTSGAGVCEDVPETEKQRLSPFEASWFSEHLIAAGESGLADDRSTDSIRFLWLRSFHHPVVIRIDQVGSGKPKLTAVELSGAGGYGPGEVSRRTVRRLTSAEGVSLRELIAATEVFENPTDECAIGVDGAEWVLERQSDARYSFEHEWSPEDGGVHKVGTFLLDLTGWDFGARY